MQRSAYLLTFPFPDHPGYRLLYSTRQASLSLLPEELLPLLEEDTMPVEVRDTLVRLGMLVPDRKEEKERLFGFLDELNGLASTLIVAVVLGLECNFACTYCYEGTMKEKVAMTDEIADQLVAFLGERFTAGKTRLVLDFYGGEPLLGVGRIKYLARALKPLVEERGGTFHFNLVTNGSLLTPKTVRELLPLGLKSAKITLDGPAAVHDRFRPFKSGRPSFEVIMKNIEACCDLVRIGVGGNFTRENFRLFPPLLDLLAERGLDPDRLGHVQFFPVMQTNDRFSLAAFRGGCASVNEPWLVEASLLLREEVMKRGYKTAKITPSTCMVDLDHALVVHYDGSLYKCIGLVGHEEFAVGHVSRGLSDYRATYNLDGWKEEPRCRDCAYLPLCFGGCRYMQLQRDGRMAGVDCQKGFWEATLPTALLQEARCRKKRTEC